MVFLSSLVIEAAAALEKDAVKEVTRAVADRYQDLVPGSFAFLVRFCSLRICRFRQIWRR